MVPWLDGTHLYDEAAKDERPGGEWLFRVDFGEFLDRAGWLRDA